MPPLQAKIDPLGARREAHRPELGRRAAPWHTDDTVDLFGDLRVGRLIPRAEDP